jgi:type I restriction enzyme M protein
MADTQSTKRSDYLGRYYTNPTVGALLVHSMALKSPTTVLDLGAGDGALVGAASKVWKQASFLTVDIDEAAHCSRLPTLRGPLFRHVTGDALDPRLADRLGLRPGEACAALCNPPYIKPRWQAHFGELLEEAGLSGALPRMGDVPADLLFVAQNLRFLKEGGRLGLILPDGIIAGEKYQLFRQLLLARHRVHTVIELPRSIFYGTEAKAHIVVVSKGPVPTETLTVRALHSNGTLSHQLAITHDRAAERLDFSFLSTRASGRVRTASNQTQTLGDLVETVGRGRYDSAAKKVSRHPILHTTDLTSRSRTPPSSFLLSRKQAACMKGPFAQPGDILIARVGRNHAEKIVLVKRGTYAVTDCLFVLRPKRGKMTRILKFLRSAQGTAALDALSHGVGARFLTVTALKNLIVPGL